LAAGKFYILETGKPIKASSLNVELAIYSIIQIGEGIIMS
jgi:hypothetical protein